jgi:light-regulated signal transduction histidine kinase (bacteriophytochrome)
LKDFTVWKPAEAEEKAVPDWIGIVKHILEAHNENITVESVYLEGTKFSFMLEKSK